MEDLNRQIADHAGEQVQRNLAAVRRELSVWYQAWAERLIVGENIEKLSTLLAVMDRSR